MKFTPKFSVIIPVYKAESFIDKCIEGMLSQTVTDFELILINDGSPDRSGELCEQYALKDSRIKVFHKDNGGPSSARNIGLDNAIGEIICFVDSDDYVAPNFLENFGLCELDITIQGFYAKKTNDEQYKYYPINEYKFNKDAIVDFLDTIHEAKNTGYLVTRAFKRKIIESNKLRLNANFHVREDEEFIWRYMCCCETFETKNKGAYYYDMPDFASKYSFVDLKSDFDCTKSIIDGIIKSTNKFDHLIIINNINRIASIVLTNYKRKNFSIKQTKEYIDEFRKYYSNVKGNKALSLKSKIIYNMINDNIPDYIHNFLHLIFLK